VTLIAVGDCVLKKSKAVLTGGGETFTASGSVVVRPGFTAIMPWKVRLMDL
jgi:DNA topoisomerase-3